MNRHSLHDRVQITVCGSSSAVDTAEVDTIDSLARGVRARHWLGGTICLLLVTGLLMACIIEVDTYALATARILPVGRSKVVQSLETGKIVQLYVQNGSIVKSGDTLVELDSSLPLAELAGQSALLDSLDAEIARLQAALQLRADQSDVESPAFKVHLDSSNFRLLSAQLDYLRANLAAAQARLTSTEKEEEGIRLALEEQSKVVAILKERLEFQRVVQAEGLGTKMAVMDAQAALGNASTQLASLRANQLHSRATIDSLRREIEVLEKRFLAETSEALQIAYRERGQVFESREKAKVAVENSKIKAPIDGRIQELAITARGQVVSAAQKVMTIVPLVAELEAEALVTNRDIGFVKVGQRTVLKIDAFPYSRYGYVSGVVSQVSQDAVNLIAEAGSPQAWALLPDGAGWSGWVYPVSIRLDVAANAPSASRIELRPGMSARAEVRTGRTTLIQYLIAPIYEIRSHKT